MKTVQGIVAAMSVSALAGCTGLPASQQSYVDPAFTAGTTAYLAGDMATKTATIVAPSKTQLVIAPTNKAQAPMGALVVAAFRKKGYAVQELTPPPPGKPAEPPKGVKLRYELTADESMILTRIELPRNMLTRGYAYRDDTSLGATGPWSNMELGQ